MDLLPPAKLPLIDPSGDALPSPLTIRCGLELCYEASAPTPAVFLLKPRRDRWQSVVQEECHFEPRLATVECEDTHGNVAHRVILPVGKTTLRHDMLVRVPHAAENFDAVDAPVPIEEIPIELLRYTLPSRYCDSDRLMDFAFAHFGEVPHGLQRVQAICDWVHKNIEYRWGAGSAHVAASEVLSQGFGVCRDFAHSAIALCRCFNLPARYITGYLPDVAFLDRGTPMDFHAYFQVYVGHRWLTYDARFNVPRIGRIKIACGLDAVDGAFSTLYGGAMLTWFNVWSYQVDPREVKLGDAVDMSKRLDGTRTLRIPG